MLKCVWCDGVIYPEEGPVWAQGAWHTSCAEQAHAALEEAFMTQNRGGDVRPF
jgi:hypothetical protein